MSVSFKERTLDNGLRVIAEVDDNAHSSAAGFFVRTGARDEPGELMGVSHYLEHMMFKGTEDLSADDINTGFDALGARNNAYTSGEMTCFYAHVIPEYLPEATELLARMMRPALRTEDFETEKGVILEEISMYDDNPFWVLYEALAERHYLGHAMGHRVLGTKQTVGDMTRDAMMGYFEDRYAANNTVLALAGKLDFDEACALAERRCGGWNRSEPARDSSRMTVGADMLEIRDEKVNRAYMLMLADAPAIDDDRRYSAAVLSKILGMADNSRLHWALIEEGLAEEAMASFDPHDGTGSYFVYASGDPDKADDIWGVIEREIAGLIGSVQPDDLERLLAKTITAATIGGERPNDRMQRIGRMWTYLGRYSPLEEELDKLAAVTLDDLRDCWEAFPMRPRTVGRLLPA